MGVSKRGSRWYVKWKDAAGIWKRQATTARTKADAIQLWHSYSERAQRERDGLAPRNLDTGHTLLSLSMWWADNKCPEPSRENAKCSLRATQAPRAIGSLPLLAVTSRALDTFFQELISDGYATRTVNRHRALIRGIFNAAKREGLWVGDNPVNSTNRIANPKTIRPTLDASEVPLVLQHSLPQWRSFMALGIYLGLRKGEICGLKKVDYDPVRRTLFVGRNYKSDTTKTKRSDTLPVSSELAKYLDEALKTPGPYLCPTRSGAPRTHDCDPQKTLRNAMRRAGFVIEWHHKCRRCSRLGAPSVVVADDDAKRKCPVCGFVLWPVSVSRHIRFHDLRHTCATLLLRAGAPIQHVMRVLRHASITTTVNTYGHLLTEDLRPILEALGAGPRLVQDSTAKTNTA
jgi:integrase